MYIISSLMLLALYQRRHVDMQSNPYVVYSVICLLIFFNVVGVYSDSGVFWAVTFVVFASLTCTCCAVCAARRIESARPMRHVTQGLPPAGSSTSVETAIVADFGRAWCTCAESYGAFLAFLRDIAPASGSSFSCSPAIWRC